MSDAKFLTHIEQTGIYEKNSIKVKTPEDIEFVMNEFTKRHNAGIAEIFDTIKWTAEHVKRELQKLKDHDQEGRPEKGDLSAILGHCLSILHAHEQGDQKTMVRDAVLLGISCERSGVRQFEPFVKIGRKRQEASRVGHEKAHGTKAEKDNRWAAMAKDFNEEMCAQKSQGCKPTKTRAYSRVAEKYKVSPSTVKSAVKRISNKLSK